VLAFNRDIWEKVEEHNAETLQEITLTPAELKVFEGYYQFEQNPNAYLQFRVKDKGLIAKQVWDGKEFFILPKSSLEFSSQAEKYPVKFTKDAKGAVTQALVFEKDVWKKVKNYSQKEPITLSPAKLKAFEGKYTLQFENGKDAFLQITAMTDHLILKEMWTGNEIKFLPVSELDFYNKDRAFPLKFTKDKTGSVTQVLAFNRDLWKKVK
jgi:hypothetical protein